MAGDHQIRAAELFGISERMLRYKLRKSTDSRRCSGHERLSGAVGILFDKSKLFYKSFNRCYSWSH